MKQQARRQILEDLGLVSWRLRVTEVRAGEASPRGAVDLDALPEAVLPTLSASAPVEPVAASSAAAGSGAPAQVPSATAAEDPSTGRPTTPAACPLPAATWAALSLALPGVVMLVDGAASRRDLRLAMDVLAAAAGDWHGKPASRRLDWPPPVAASAIAMDEEAGSRALGAFAGKDVADHTAKLLVCVASLARRLPENEPGCRRLVVPDLEELGREPTAKRDLWRELADARS